MRLRHDPKPTYFGIPSLDNIINIATSTSTHPTTNPNATPTRTAPIIDLTSQHPGSGTTHLLYALTATAILPTANGGQNACVAILDTDGTFSISRLVQQLQFQLQLQLPPDSPTLKIALSHIHIFTPQSLPSLIHTLTSLPSYFLNSTAHPSASRRLAFIALDSATAFDWQGRAAAEQESEHRFHTNTRPIYPEPDPAKPSLPAAIQSLSHSLPVPILLSRPAHLTPPHMQPAVRLVFNRTPTRGFAPTLSVSEALREAPEREKAVRAAGWGVKVFACKGRVREIVAIGMRIGESGVELDDGWCWTGRGGEEGGGGVVFV